MPAGRGRRRRSGRRAGHRRADQHARRLDPGRGRHRDGRADARPADLVAMAWIGDGATSTGAFHEGLNFAAVQKLPAGRRRRGQQVRLLDADREADGHHAHRRARRRLRYSARDGRRQRHPGGLRRREADGRPRPRRRGRGADRRRHDAHAGARAARRRALRAEGAARASGREKDPIARLPAAAARARRRDATRSSTTSTR